MRTLYPQYMESFIEDDSVQALHEWSQAYKPQRPPFEVSRVVDIANVWRKLRKIPDDYELVPTSEEFLIDEEKMLEAFANSELMPELLDAWKEEERGPDDDDDESFALNLHFDDSIME